MLYNVSVVLCCYAHNSTASREAEQEEQSEPTPSEIPTCKFQVADYFGSVLSLLTSKMKLDNIEEGDNNTDYKRKNPFWEEKRFKKRMHASVPLPLYLQREFAFNSSSSQSSSNASTPNSSSPSSPLPPVIQTRSPNNGLSFEERHLNRYPAQTCILDGFSRHLPKSQASSCPRCAAGQGGHFRHM